MSSRLHNLVDAKDAVASTATPPIPVLWTCEKVSNSFLWGISTWEETLHRVCTTHFGRSSRCLSGCLSVRPLMHGERVSKICLLCHWAALINSSSRRAGDVSVSPNGPPSLSQYRFKFWPCELVSDFVRSFVGVFFFCGVVSFFAVSFRFGLISNFYSVFKFFCSFLFYLCLTAKVV